jgi:hypothetical protein
MAIEAFASLLSINAIFSNAVLALGLGYAITLIVGRLYLSPLSGFLGPKIAAITSQYAMYHNIVRGGRYIWVVDEMHKRYG